MNIHTTEDIKNYLNTFGLDIKRVEFPPERSGMILIKYSIININANIVVNKDDVVDEDGHVVEALLDLWLCYKDTDGSIRKLSVKIKQQFNELKKIIEPVYCSTAWVNGSKTYKNLGKFIIYYMILDCFERYKLFINKLDNASDSRDTYKIFGFHAVEEGGEEEIMCSSCIKTLEKLKEDMSRIKISKKREERKREREEEEGKGEREEEEGKGEREGKVSKGGNTNRKRNKSNRKRNKSNRKKNKSNRKNKSNIKKIN